ncbi:MAG: 4Fe-4S binding protein, partial [Acetanaerobacterium sp.]
MGKMTVNETICKGCGVCVLACPKKIISLADERINIKGYHPAHVKEMDKCTGCAMCATMCPD